MTHYVAYLRASTEQQGKSGLGLEAQEAAIVAFLKPEDALVLPKFVEVEFRLPVGPSRACQGNCSLPHDRRKTADREARSPRAQRSFCRWANGAGGHCGVRHAFGEAFRDARPGSPRGGCAAPEQRTHQERATSCQSARGQAGWGSWLPPVSRSTGARCSRPRTQGR